MLDDWTNAGFDPFASPQETGSAFGPKNGSNKEAITRHRVTAKRMIGAPGDEPTRSDESGFPINRHFRDVPQDKPEVLAEPGFEDEVRQLQPLRLPLALRRDLEPVDRLRLQGEPLLPDDGGVHPAGHPRQRPRRVVRAAQRRDPVGGRGPRDGRRARARDDEGRRRRGHARRHPPSRLLAEALDAAGVGERLARSCRSSTPAARCRPRPSSSRPRRSAWPGDTVGQLAGTSCGVRQASQRPPPRERCPARGRRARRGARSRSATSARRPARWPASARPTAS